MLGTKFLHPILYIVADQPSPENLSPAVPLVGTASYKTLLSWFAEMNVDITRVRLYNQIDAPFSTPLSKHTLNKAVELGQIQVIALGQKAAAYLMKEDIDEFFVLPHPSPSNRLLNNPEFVKEKLGFCRTYIYEGVINGGGGFKELTDDIQDA
jgi:hypothetical protein